MEHIDKLMIPEKIEELETIISGVSMSGGLFESLIINIKYNETSEKQIKLNDSDSHNLKIFFKKEFSGEKFPECLKDKPVIAYFNKNRYLKAIEFPEKYYSTAFYIEKGIYS